MTKFYEKVGHALAMMGILALFCPLRVGAGWVVGWFVSSWLRTDLDVRKDS